METYIIYYKEVISKNGMTKSHRKVFKDINEAQRFARGKAWQPFIEDVMGFVHDAQGNCVDVLY